MYCVLALCLPALVIVVFRLQKPCKGRLRVKATTRRQVIVIQGGGHARCPGGACTPA